MDWETWSLNLPQFDIDIALILQPFAFASCSYICSLFKTNMSKASISTLEVKFRPHRFVYDDARLPRPQEVLHSHSSLPSHIIPNIFCHNSPLNNTIGPLTPLMPGSSDDCNISSLLPLLPLLVYFYHPTQFTQLAPVISVAMSTSQSLNAGDNPDSGPDPGSGANTGTSTRTGSDPQGSYWRAYGPYPPQRCA